jgi:transcriptional regulator with XRE-family HTH domain
MQMQAVENFRSNVRAALAYSGWSQDSLATETELSRPFVNRILQGKQEPSLAVCDRIADALHVPLATLLGEPKKFQKIFRKAIAS